MWVQADIHLFKGKTPMTIAELAERIAEISTRREFLTMSVADLSELLDASDWAIVMAVCYLLNQEQSILSTANKTMQCLGIAGATATVDAIAIEIGEPVSAVGSAIDWMVAQGFGQSWDDGVN